MSDVPGESGIPQGLGGVLEPQVLEIPAANVSGAGIDFFLHC